MKEGGTCSFSLSQLEPAVLMLIVRELFSNSFGGASSTMPFFREKEEMESGLRKLLTVATLVDQRVLDSALPNGGDRSTGGANGVRSSLLIGTVIHREDDASSPHIRRRLERLLVGIDVPPSKGSSPS